MNRRIAIIAGLAVALFLVLVLVVARTTKRATSGKIVSTQADALYQQALSLQAEGSLKQAALVYQELIRQFPNFKQISDAEERLWDLNIKVLFSPIVGEKDILYKVEAGDTLGKIAAQHNTTVDLIMHSNNLKNHLIRPGKRLKVSAATYSVIVVKSQNSLALKANDDIFKIYSVATGKYNSTPVGTFTISQKLIDPDWYKEGEGIIPADDPKNVLGTRWLGFAEEPGYGIHGGAKDEDLASQVTDGCIRMRDPEVEELFTILPRGTKVAITD